MSEVKTEYKIATFGCWNNYKHVNSRIPMKNVTDYLKKVEKEYTDLIILGDNYYEVKDKGKGKDKDKVIDPNTGEKIKKINVNELEFEDGFNMVESINIPNKYLIMGNHDVEDILNDCNLLKLQLAKKDKFTIKFPYGKNEVSVGDTKYKYLFIDTNLYDLINKTHTCFNIIYQKDVDELLCEQNRFITDELNDDTVNKFLIFGHEPLISLKTKIDLEKDLDSKISLLNKELLNILFNSDKEIIYVCADVHMYQNGIIKNSDGKTIQQIVCGTGGADKDYYCLPNKNYKHKTYDFELVNFVDSYGYVEIILTPDKIDHQYIKIYPDLTISKYSKKYYVNYNYN